MPSREFLKLDVLVHLPKLLPRALQRDDRVSHLLGVFPHVLLDQLRVLHWMHTVHRDNSGCANRCVDDHNAVEVVLEAETRPAKRPT